MCDWRVKLLQNGKTYSRQIGRNLHLTLNGDSFLVSLHLEWVTCIKPNPKTFSLTSKVVIFINENANIKSGNMKTLLDYESLRIRRYQKWTNTNGRPRKFTKTKNFETTLHINNRKTPNQFIFTEVVMILNWYSKSYLWNITCVLLHTLNPLLVYTRIFMKKKERHQQNKGERVL